MMITHVRGLSFPFVSELIFVLVFNGLRVAAFIGVLTYSESMNVRRSYQRPIL